MIFYDEGRIIYTSDLFSGKFKELLSMASNMKALIVGGVGNMGQWFIAECARLDEMAQSHDRDALILEINKIADHFGTHNVGFGLMTSKKIVDHLVNE